MGGSPAPRRPAASAARSQAFRLLHLRALSCFEVERRHQTKLRSARTYRCEGRGQEERGKAMRGERE
eukprot:7532594-Pyramimonas_sp.AAC.1